jgi:hypothetical protein
MIQFNHDSLSSTFSAQRLFNCAPPPLFLYRRAARPRRTPDTAFLTPYRMHTTLIFIHHALPVRHLSPRISRGVLTICPSIIFVSQYFCCIQAATRLCNLISPTLILNTATTLPTRRVYLAFLSCALRSDHTRQNFSLTNAQAAFPFLLPCPPSPRLRSIVPKPCLAQSIYLIREAGSYRPAADYNLCEFLIQVYSHSTD